MRLLMLSHLFPYPADNGAKLRLLNLMLQLRGHELTVLVPPASADSLAALAAKLDGPTVAVAPWPVNQGWSSWRGYLARPPREIYPAGPELPARQVIDHWVHYWQPDLLIASDPILGEYLRCYPGHRRLMDIAAEYALYCGRTAQLSGPAARVLWQLRRLKWAGYTRSLAGSVDQWSVPSPVDRQALAGHLAPDARIAVIPNGVDPTINHYSFEPQPPPRLVYCGALSYEPNRDAVLYFCREIWPLVRQRVPDAEFVVTGEASGAPDELQHMPGVRLTGRLPEVRSLMVSSCAAAVPLRLGVGTRLKILEAMAVGTPVIATSIGAEGLAVNDGEHLLIADDAARFADGAIRLLTGPALRARLSRNGRALVEARYAWSVIGQAWRETINALIPSAPLLPAGLETSLHVR